MDPLRLNHVFFFYPGLFPEKTSRIGSQLSDHRLAGPLTLTGTHKLVGPGKGTTGDLKGC